MSRFSQYIRTQKITLSFLFYFILGITSCGSNTDAVSSGKYNGKVKKVEAAKTEIYVTLEDGKTVELYFLDNTKLTKGNETVDFSVLEPGQKVEIEVKKVGKRLEPLSVNIHE